MKGREDTKKEASMERERHINWLLPTCTPTEAEDQVCYQRIYP